MKVEEFLTLITRKLETMVEGGDRTLADCFSISAVCTSFSNQREETTQELEQVTMAFAERFYRTLNHLTVSDPTSSVLEDMRTRYQEVFPRQINFTGFPSRHMIIVINTLIRDYSSRHQAIWRDDDRPSDDDHIQFARDIAEHAQAKYQRRHRVPESILNFALDSMFLDPLPPASIVVYCLKVIAIALGCDVSGVSTSDERYVCLGFINAHLLTTLSVQVEVVLNLISRRLGAGQGTIIYDHSRAVCALTPYAIFMEKCGQEEIANAIMHVVRGSSDRYFMSSVQPHITTLLGKPNSPFRNWLIAVVVQYVNWEDEEHGEDAVVAWAAAVSTAPDTGEVISGVVRTLMQITKIDSLRPHIPIEIWVWMKKLRSLPVTDWPPFVTTTPDAVRHIRGLGDFETIGLYFLVAFASYQSISTDVLDEVEISIRGDFGGIGMWGHREILLNQLDSILERKASNWEGLKRCRKLKGVLLTMDREATKTFARKFLKLVPLNNNSDLDGHIQGLIPPLCALSPFLACDHWEWLVLLCSVPSRHLLPPCTMIHHIFPFPSCPF